MKSVQEDNVERLHETQPISGVKTGLIEDISDAGEVRVSFAESPFPSIDARRAASVKLSSLREAVRSRTPVILMFEDGDPLKPIIIDTVGMVAEEEALNTEPVSDGEQGEAVQQFSLQPSDIENLQLEGETISFDAKQQITFKCGKSSITLTKAGKIILRGTYLSNRSSGVMKIKGAAVEIN